MDGYVREAIQKIEQGIAVQNMLQSLQLLPYTEEEKVELIKAIKAYTIVRARQNDFEVLEKKLANSEESKSPSGLHF